MVLEYQFFYIDNGINKERNLVNKKHILILFVLTVALLTVVGSFIRHSNIISIAKVIPQTNLASYGKK